MICGMPVDSITNIDALYIFASDTQINAKLNLISSSFPITVNGACTFTTNQGFTGDASSCSLGTAFTPVALVVGNFSQNSDSFSVYDLTSRTLPDGSWAIISGEYWRTTAFRLLD